MSLMTLVSEAVEERRPADPVAPGFRDAEPQSVVVDKNDVPHPRTPPVAVPAQRAKPRAAAPAGAIEALVRFFPAEVMLLYIPGVAMMQSHFKNDAAWPLLLFYVAWILATPLLIWLVFDGELKKSGFGLADRLPLRQMVLGLVSFAAWGACVPGVFPEQQWFLGWMALVVATLLPQDRQAAVRGAHLGRIPTMSSSAGQRFRTSDETRQSRRQRMLPNETNDTGSSRQDAPPGGQIASHAVAVRACPAPCCGAESRLAGSPRCAKGLLRASALLRNGKAFGT